MTKLIYEFSEGNMSMRDLLGGKGANLAEMTNLGLPVPHGFTLTTVACHEYQQTQSLSDEVLQQLDKELTQLSRVTGKQFNGTDQPLLVSVRSGAAISMPGMMDTILNIGLNDQTVVALANLTHNERFAYDSYRRLLAMFGNVVYGIEEDTFDNVLTKVKRVNGYQSDLELTAADLKQIVTDFKAIYQQAGKGAFPQSPKDQLLAAVNAVFESWNNHRAQVYRQQNHIPESLGTAVNVQEMVFGNAGDQSGTGVAFTRNPATGEKKVFGEYLLNAQGEDVVAGIRTPQSIGVTRLCRLSMIGWWRLPAETITATCRIRNLPLKTVSCFYRKAHVMSIRSGKNCGGSVDEGLINKKQAVQRIPGQNPFQRCYIKFDGDVLAQQTPAGLPASPGAATTLSLLHCQKTR